MQVSPLLPAQVVRSIAGLLREPDVQPVLDHLAPLALEERVHILRFLACRGLDNAAYVRLLNIWSTVLPSTHRLDTPDLRLALWRQSEWWDAFGLGHQMTVKEYDRLEALLDQVGCTAEGVDYFQWVALHPMYERVNAVWDEERRGAIISLARYAYIRAEGSQERFLARHLDDWINVQTDVIDILVAMKSRLLAHIAPWYLQHDPDLRPFLEDCFSA